MAVARTRSATRTAHKDAPIDGADSLENKPIRDDEARTDLCAATPHIERVTTTRPTKRPCEFCRRPYRPRSIRQAKRSRFCSNRCRMRAARRRAEGPLAGILRAAVDQARRGTLDPALIEGIAAQLGLVRPEDVQAQPRAPRTKKPAAAKKPRTASLPWPRSAPDGTPLGLDVKAHFADIARVVAKGRFSAPGMGIDDLIAEVCLVVMRRNAMPSAYDPRKASVDTYIKLLARHFCANTADSQKHADLLTGEGSLEDTADFSTNELIDRFEAARLDSSVRASRRASL